MRRLSSILLLCAVAACDTDVAYPRVCTDQLNSTIALRIRHAATGASEGPGSTVIVRNATVYDSVTITTPQFAEFDYRATEDKVGGGEYTVTVRKSGFITQSFQATVTADECHAGPGPQIEVRLVPMP